MNTQMEEQFNRLETERKNLFHDLKKYTDEQLNQKPSPQAWSVAEVIAHVMAAEEYSLKYLQKKVQNTNDSPSEGIKQKWRWLLIKSVFSCNIKFKAPEIGEPKVGYTELTTLYARWTGTRTEIAKILSKLSDKELNKTLWKHAVAGKLNLHHMVQFFGIHFKRHKKQIERTLAVVK